jgi:cytochrome c-type biogenesis protein CcmF
MALGQFFHYKNTNLQAYWRKISGSLLASLAATTFVAWATGFSLPKDNMHLVLLFTGIFGTIANGNYILQVLKGRFDFAGSSVSHIGFAILITGALITTSRSKEISRNDTGFDVSLLSDQFSNHENILLRKNDTLRMDEYFVTYRGKKQQGTHLYYEVGYYAPAWNQGTQSYQPGDSLFTLYPFVQLNEKFGNVPEPGTRHMLTRDIFTHIKWADLSVNPADGKEDDDFMGETKLKLTLKDTATYENMAIYFENIELVHSKEEKLAAGLQENDIVVKASLKVGSVYGKNKQMHAVNPLFVVRDSSLVIPHTIHANNLDTKFRITELGKEPNTLTLGIQEREYMVMEAIVFPYINVLWIGCFVMTIGCLMSMRGYWIKKRGTKKNPAAISQEELVMG